MLSDSIFYAGFNDLIVPFAKNFGFLDQLEIKQSIAPLLSLDEFEQTITLVENAG